MNPNSFYFEDDALEALKLVAAGSVLNRVPETIHIMLAVQLGTIEWKTEIDGIFTRAHHLGLPDLSAFEIAALIRASRREKSASGVPDFD